MPTPPKLPGADDKEKNQNQNPTGSEGGEGDAGDQGDDKGKDDKGGNAGGDQGQGDEDDKQVDLAKLPKGAQKLIAKLRAENAGARTKNKELGEGHAKLKKALIDAGLVEDDSIEPEKQVEVLSAQTTALGIRNAILEACVDHGVGRDHSKYFEFLVSSELDALGENEELSDERIAELAAEAKKAPVRAAKSTSVGDGKGKGQGAGAGKEPPPEGGKSEVTLGQFVKMNVFEKSALYQKQPEVYNRLKDEAKEKNLFAR